MITEIRKFTEAEYEDELAKYYEKPNPPEIEVTLKALQKRIVVDQDYSCFDEFKTNIFNYTKSLLLKAIAKQNAANAKRMQAMNPGGADLSKKEFIDPAQASELASKATDSFIRRYFRLENPIVGASFAGILDFKCREVLSPYHKNKKLEAPISIDDVFGSDEDGKNTLEQKLSYDLWMSSQGASTDQKSLAKKCLGVLDRECDLLDRVEDEKNLSTQFLEYLTYLLLLQKSKPDFKINKLTKCALGCANIEDEHIISIMESSYLDLFA